MPGNANFDALLSTTLANYRSQLTDNVFTARPLTYTLMEKGRIRMLNGGTKIVEPLIYGQNDTVKSYSDYDSINLTPQTGISAAEYDWKQYAASISISGIEEAKNRGKEQVIKLLNAKITQAEGSLQELMNQQLFTGTGATTNFFGIDVIAGTTGNSVGGIDGATETWWNPTVTNVGGALTLLNMAAAYNDASKGNDVPDIIVTTQAQYQKYEALLTPNVRYQDVSKANAGFQNLMFKSTPVVFDKVATSGRMSFLNTKYLKLTGMAGNWFTTTPFQQGIVNGKDARYAAILAYGALTCSNRDRQATLTGLT